MTIDTVNMTYDALGRIAEQNQSAMEGSASGIDESCDFFLGEDYAS